MFNQVDDVNMLGMLGYILMGILICCFAIFIIKVMADYIWQTGKILYKRYLIPIFIVAIPILFYNEISHSWGMNIPFKAFQILGVIAVLLIFLNIVSKVGLIRGLCLFIIQLVGAVLCVCAIYAGVVIMVAVFALVMGGTWLVEGNFICMIALDDGEMVYVRSIQDYYIDQQGRTYFRNEKYVYRVEDNKFFVFYE